MSEHAKFPTLYDNDNYLIFRDKDIVTLVDHGRGASSMFGYEEWREFSRVIVAAANKDCENEAKGCVVGVEVSVIDGMIEKAIKPLQDRIDGLERELHGPTEGESEDTCKEPVINIVNKVSNDNEKPE